MKARGACAVPERKRGRVFYTQVNTLGLKQLLKVMSKLDFAFFPLSASKLVKSPTFGPNPWEKKLNKWNPLEP